MYTFKISKVISLNFSKRGVFDILTVDLNVVYMTGNVYDITLHNLMSFCYKIWL